jgi:hypothetical protein
MAKYFLIFLRVLYHSVVFASLDEELTLVDLLLKEVCGEGGDAGVGLLIGSIGANPIVRRPGLFPASGF